jgi:prepilin-type N-terminal cleavage/methylation domain-containing protein
MNNILNAKNRGVTLLEVLITMAIFSLIVGVLGSFVRNIYYFENIFSGGITTYDEARKILQPIASEIRSASQSSLGSYPLEKTSPTEFIFYTDINNDGLKERIRYFISGDIMKRGVVYPTGNPIQYPLSSEKITNIVHGLKNEANPVFSYYNSSYNGNTSPLSQPVSIIDVRLVKILLILDADPKRPPAPVTVTTQVNIRNLKDNL